MQHRHSVLVSGVILVAVSLAACVTSEPAQPPQRLAMKQEESVVSFTGDDRFIVERFRFVPPGKGLLNYEQLRMRDGVIDYVELMPTLQYTQGSKDQESAAMVESWHKQKAFVDRELSIVKSEVKDSHNLHGTYFFAVKGGAKGTCGSARQVFGKKTADNFVSAGNQRFFVIVCRSGNESAALETYLRDIMTRMRMDDGEINRANAAARATGGASADPKK